MAAAVLPGQVWELVERQGKAGVVQLAGDLAERAVAAEVAEAGQPRKSAWVR